MISELSKVRLVILAYLTVIKELRHANFVKVKAVKVGPIFDNALRFYQLSETAGASLFSLIVTSLDLYPEDWCMKTFRRSYPPFNVVIGEKCRNKILKNYPMTVKSKPDNLTNFYFRQLKDLPVDTAIKFVEDGHFGTEAIRDNLLDLLRERLTEEI